MEEKPKKIPKARYVTEYRKPKEIFSRKPPANVGGLGEKHRMGIMDRFVLQTFVCLVLLGAVLLCNNINSTLTNNVVKGVRWTMGWKLDKNTMSTFMLGLRQKAQEDETKKDGVIGNEEDKTSQAPEVIPSVEEEGFAYPLENQAIVTSNFGERMHPIYHTMRMHKGVDLDAAYGDEIKSSTSGTVEYVGEDDTDGKYIRIQNGDYQVTYAHCSKIIAKQGQTVRQGDVIAEVGDTGLATAPHLHFEIWEKGTPIDPLTKLQQETPNQ